MLEFRDVQVKFNQFVAINQVNIEVQEGEFFTFLGPSGSGKTTTLRTLVGFNVPSQGRIYLKGRDITEMPIEERGIGMIFQSYSLFHTMNVRENLEYGLREANWSEADIEKRIQEVAEMANLKEKHMTKNVWELSGGQQQRIAMAKALAPKPSVLAMDEPLSNLDPRLRKQLRRELKAIQRASNATIIYVTHVQEEALNLSDRIAIFDSGEVVQIGSPQEVYQNPKTPYVATFLGETHHIGERMREAINRSSQRQILSPDRDYYIRSENFQIVKNDFQVEEDALLFHARFVGESFNGSTYTLIFEANGEEFQTMVLASLRKEMKVGQEVMISVQKSHLLSYELSS